MTAYQQLEARLRRLGVLDGVGQVLHWDRAVMMPPGGATSRADQLAELSLLQHEMITAPDMGDLLAAADQEGGALSDWQSANLREMRRLWHHATAVPGDLVSAMSHANSTCEMLWRTARERDDFAAVVPALEDVVNLVRQMAQAKADALGLSPYDALLDAYDPGMRRAEIDGIFSELRLFLPDLIGRVIDRQAAGPALLPVTGKTTVAAQRALGERIMTALGFDTDFGRLDVSHHPFSSGVPDDVRITTRYKADAFTESLMGVIHETGHALYERGLPADWRWQPVGVARGMTMHESQSLLMEMQACRSPAFVAFAAPIMRETFGGAGPSWETDNLLRLYHKVARSLIRVEADEVTYPAHILLRYDLESAMVAGDLRVADLPGAWRDGLHALLGVDVSDDKDGCMQDIHWYGGSFGYFPTYTLGAMAAAQLFHAASASDPGVMAGIGRGNFAPLLTWLRAHVHSKGSLLSTNELLASATGAPLGAAAFRAHVERRYLG
ncbi:MAG: carboxypeptidase M32 [Proteobacteria bacterium]|nr:carboxypeptidase M32 [Pseudomonadota bacterium]